MFSVPIISLLYDLMDELSQAHHVRTKIMTTIEPVNEVNFNELRMLAKKIDLFNNLELSYLDRKEFIYLLDALGIEFVDRLRYFLRT